MKTESQNLSMKASIAAMKAQGFMLPEAVFVILEFNEKIVCVKSRNRLEDLHLPGGKIEDNEDMFTAANRELEEELGVKNLSFSHLETRIMDYNPRRPDNVWREHFLYHELSDAELEALTPGREVIDVWLVNPRMIHFWVAATRKGELVTSSKVLDHVIDRMW